MDLLATEEQQHIVDTAAKFLADQFPVKRLLGKADGTTVFTGEHLQQIANLGWIGIGLPDDFAGVGYGLSEEALLFVELGRSLMPPSLLGSAIGARIAALGGARAELSAIINGKSRVGVASATGNIQTTIGETVSGEFLVYEANDTELAVVADQNGAALLSLPEPQHARKEHCIDETLQLSTWQMQNTPALVYLPAARDAIFLRSALLTSAMLLGIAEATLTRSVEYAKQRHQFGKAIGSFQAIKHYCADMAIRCESVRALLYHASITLAGGTPAGDFDTLSLKALANDAAKLNANTAVQIHGGMGFTREMDIHFFVKRAQVLSTLFGSERFHLHKLLSANAPN